MGKLGAVSTLLLLCSFALGTPPSVMADQVTSPSPVSDGSAESTVKSADHASTTPTTVETVNDVFIPEKDWKVIKPGQAIPAGLHVRMNFETGVNEAKLMDKEENAPTSKAMVLVPEAKSTEGETETKTDGEPPRTHLRADLEEALKNIDKGQQGFDEEEISEEEKQKIRQKFRSMKELKEEFAAMNMQIQTDREILRDLMGKYQAKNGAVTEETAEKLTFLQDMEYYVHQIDNAQDFLEMGGVPLIRQVLNESSPVLRAEGANLVGSAAQNNPKAQILLLENGILSTVLSTIAKLGLLSADPATDRILSRNVYALSALIRNFPIAQQQMVELGGVKGLASILLNTKLPRTLHGRVIGLVADLLTERDDTRTACRDPDTLDREVQEERLRQYDVTFLEDAIRQHWPGILTDYLDADDHDMTRAVLRIFRFLKVKREEIPSAVAVVEKLQTHFVKLQRAAVNGEEASGEGDFRELAELCRLVLDGQY